MLASDIIDICPFPTLASVLLTSVFSVSIFSSFSSVSTSVLRALSNLLWPVLPRRMVVTVTYRTNWEMKYAISIINCVAIYYEEGASGNAFLWKEKFRAKSSERNCQVCLLFKPV